MSKNYVIQWKSKVNGRAGRGTKFFDREEGEELVQELNHDYPDIEHELVNTEGRPPSTPSAVETTAESETVPEEAEHASVHKSQVISFDA